MDMGRQAVAGKVIPSPISGRRHGGRPWGPRSKGVQRRSTLFKMERSSPGIPDPTDPDEIELDDVPREMPNHLTWEQPSRWTPKPGIKRSKFEGLSEKEKFEALGMDETWTEYNVLVNECPNPGVYVTPQGKRRPAGRKQGRPARSRIAVFKSAKLSSIPWFQSEKGDTGNENIGEKAIPTESDVLPIPVPRLIHPDGFTASPPAANVPFTTRNATWRKRVRDVSDLTDAPTPTLAASEAQQCSPRRPQKQPRLEEPRDEADGALKLALQSPTRDGSIQITNGVGSLPPVTRRKSSMPHPLTEEEAGAATPKRRRIGSADLTPALEDQPITRTEATQSPEKQASGPTRTRIPRPFSREWLSKAMSPTTDKADQPPKLAHGSADRGGSVSLLRRNIIMEIVEKAGGAYPSTPEIWFPFATVWLRRRQKERPDNRTVKTAIRNLVEAGKLRQLTFCGKGPKGAMVTKTILAKPEMSPDDPLIKEMQRKLLATTDQRVSYSPNIELDPELVRHSGQTGVPKGSLPVVSGTTVQLQQKPATVLAEEQRTERRIQKDLLKKLEDQLGIRDPSATGTKRLMRIGRRPRYLGQDYPQTLIAQPGGRIKSDSARLFKLLSAIGPHAMLMHPQQIFHPSSGTFGTFEATKRPRPSVRELAELASAPNTTLGGRFKTFHSKAERILRWELENEEIFDEAHDVTGTYIEHTVSDEFENVPIEGEIRFDFDLPVARAPPPRSLMTTRYGGTLREIRPRPPSERFHQHHKFDPAPVRRRIDGVDTSIPGQYGVQPDDLRIQRPRRRAALAPLDETLFRKIMVAIVAVRVLAGGVEATRVDWDLVCAAFPKHDPFFIHDHAKIILNKSRLQITGMQRDFQERYLEAYEKQKVPVIDYTNLGNYNWPAVVEWANIELEFSTSEKSPLLPTTREAFDSLYELRPDDAPTADELYISTQTTTVSARRGLMAQIPFVVQASAGQGPTIPVSRKNELARLEVVKTWVRANVAASETTYNPPRAEEALKPFGTQLINSAVQALLTDRVISMGNKGRVQPGRNYDLTDHLLGALSRKRLIDCPILKRAAYFKTEILDPQLQSTGSLDVHYHAEDGDILALINLSDHGQVTLHPRGAPRNKWGLADGGYITRQMDKARVRFDIEVRPSPAYIYGNPVQDKANGIAAPLPPKSDDPKLPPKLPLWFDIHGYLIPQLWEMAIATILGCISMRQGLSPETISSMIKPAMGAWEIELLLNWLREVGVVERQSLDGKDGWRLRQWWWMVLTQNTCHRAMPDVKAASEPVTPPVTEPVTERVEEPAHELVAEPVTHVDAPMPDA